MLTGNPQTISTDVLVIGGGGAGLRAAIEARKNGREVLLVSRSKAGYGNNTAISMAMFAASGGDREPRDNPQVHLKDTVVAGCYLNDQELAGVMTEGAWQQVRDLEAMGVNFKKSSGQHLWIMHVPGHTYSRHVTANRTLGVEFTGPMRDYASKTGVRFLDGVEVVNLLVDGGEAFGAAGLDERGNVFVIRAGVTVLASGGAGEAFLRTNNAGGSSGDGFAFCYEAGLPLVDMELVQFYPTTLGKYGGRLWSYEVIVGRGATLRNSRGEDILEKHGLKDFMKMTRDKLARAIMLEILAGNAIDGRLKVDLGVVPPDNLDKVLRVIEAQRYPREAMVAPAAHHFMGGVVINRDCETGVNGLLAAGEVCGGIHGANRLAGNALTDIFVFGAIAGRQAARLDPGQRKEVPGLIRKVLDGLRERSDRKGEESIEAVEIDLRTTMWEKAGIVRNEQSLEKALAQVKAGRERLAWAKIGTMPDVIKLTKLESMFLVAEMVCRAALHRKESRGSHYRTDYPEQNDRDWLRNTVITRKGSQMELTTRPVAFPRIPRP
ncbi:MAG: FAD-binding protein [Chloroflexi bacterium]|nr:FAD-binding protein [Chloroflexota bacterium]